MAIPTDRLLVELLPNIGTALVIPILVSIAWLLLRWLGELGLSSGLDLVGGKMAADLAIAATPATWLPFIQPSFRNVLSTALIILVVLAIIVGAVLIRIERKFLRRWAALHLRSIGQPVPQSLAVGWPYGWLALTWFLTTSLVLLNGVVFLVGIRLAIR